jgi:Icc-related predicted phosphoesterase
MVSTDEVLSRHPCHPIRALPEDGRIMEIIAFGDIHMATDVALTIPGIAAARLVILNGDLSNCGGVSEVRKVLDAVMRVNHRVLAQYGNFDRPEVNDFLEELGINIHAQARLIEGRVCVIGVGGSNFTPFNTPSEFSEKILYELATLAFRQGAEVMAAAETLTKRKIPVILVCHAPPVYTMVDRLRSGKHVGSKAIRAIIEQYQPDLCICGHIHESRGMDKVGKTPVYNPGMLGEGGWLRITFQQSQLNVTLQ